MKMTFYYFPLSNSTRVHWALEELGLPYEKVQLNLYEKQEHRTPEYLALNPNGKVPLLVVDGQPIWESLAQLLFLADTFGVEKGLFPKTPLERAEAFKWMAWFMVSLHANSTKYYDNSLEMDENERNDFSRLEAIRQATEQLKMLDDHLKKNEYLAGGSFSLADVTIASSIPKAHMMELDTSPFKSVEEWSRRCLARPAFARAE